MYSRSYLEAFVLLSAFLFLSIAVFSQPGKDGAETLTTTNVIFNRYDVLAASATAGSSTITISNIANLSASAIAGAANNPYTTNALSAGDLLMIIKMQGATISTVDASTYGSISAYNNAGVYEMKVVQSISGNNITLTTSLVNSFAIGGTQRVQVVRVPRLNALIINNGASLTGQAWYSGSVYAGGIIAVEVYGNAIINGTINANALGFRGGEVHGSTQNLGVTAYASSNPNDGAVKGEGIAGYKTDLGITYYCRGAAANGGGGGTEHNSGGGGGANAGSVASWTGQGNPDASGTNWSTAWNLESTNFATSTSSGGGRGGYSYSLSNGDALQAPGGPNNWRGDSRRNVGGLGGRPLTYTTSTLFLGGGGGAGDQNNNSGTRGGNGGGIIYLHVNGTLSGSGSITANGEAGPNTVIGDNTSGVSMYNDAAGGGGGGGAVKLNVQAGIWGITVTASGGKGGDQTGPAAADEAYGPGGGGGCGYIGVVDNPSITMTASGGANGMSTSGGVSEFIPNGATKGSSCTPTINLVYAPSIDAPLPVGLKCFDIIEAGTDALQINWNAYDEVDVLKYELEQSFTLQKWTVLGIQLSKPGNDAIKKYTLTIKMPTENTFYRIKAVDLDGSYTYTCVQPIKSSNKKITVSQAGGRLYVTHLNTPCAFKLFSSYGQEMKINVSKTNSFSTIDRSYLPKGLYYLQILTGNDKMVYEFVN